MDKSFLYLIGRTKQDVIEEFGHGFNFYPDNQWTYIIGEKLIIIQKVLYISFEETVVVQVNIRSILRV